MTTRRSTTHRSTPRSWTLLAAGSLLLGACAGAPQADDSAEGGAGYPVVVDDCGEESTITAAPERAVTMNQGATEVALALGLQDRLAGTAYLDDEVAEAHADAYESVDVLSDEYPGQESLLKAEPDFVYASYTSAFDDQTVASRAELADLGIGTYTSPLGCKDTDTDVTFENVWGEIETVADVFDVADRADALVEEQRTTLEQLGEDAAGDGLDVFWYDSGDKAPLAGAGESGPQLVLEAVGATNVFADVEGGWTEVPWEDVVEADPDVIVLADASWSSAEEKRAYLEKDPVLKDLRAVREGRIVTVPYSASTPGVRLVEGASTVAEQITALG